MRLYLIPLKIKKFFTLLLFIITNLLPWQPRTYLTNENNDKYFLFLCFKHILSLNGLITSVEKPLNNFCYKPYDAIYKLPYFFLDRGRYRISIAFLYSQNSDYENTC